MQVADRKQNMGCFQNRLLQTKYYILHTAYCMHYVLYILHTKGSISIPSVHTVVHWQVTQSAFSIKC